MARLHVTTISGIDGQFNNVIGQNIKYNLTCFTQYNSVKV